MELGVTLERLEVEDKGSRNECAESVLIGTESLGQAVVASSILSTTRQRGIRLGNQFRRDGCLLYPRQIDVLHTAQSTGSKTRFGLQSIRVARTIISFVFQNETYYFGRRKWEVA
jgi:hypothetical protein